MVGPVQERDFRLGWSLWRRAHQPVAARCRAAKHVLAREGSSGHRAPPSVTVVAPVEADLSDAEWELVRPLLRQKPPTGRPYHDHRRVVGGILWVARTGSSWREMPEEYGKWETAYQRWRLWLGQGLWQRILRALGEEGCPGPATKGGDLSL